MPRFARFLGLLLVLGVGCGSATPAPGSPTSAARGAVDVAKDAWVTAASACVDAAEEANSYDIRQKCAEVLVPARALILDAANAVDTEWSPKAACDLAQAAALIAQAAASLPVQFSKDISAVIQDAAVLAQAAAGSAACSASDAGVGG